MRAKLFFLTILLVLSSQASAQNTIRRLPPSLERELKLRKGGKVRIIGFIDTLKAQNLIAQSIRDSSAEELDSTTTRDTAIIMIDSSVSLTDKEWLDSMLAELPEYRATPEGIRFLYPSEILVETTREIVPPDTTLPSKMDPVTKEDLPLYDASPMPRPLSGLSIPNTSVELGAGMPYLPRIDLHSRIINNDKSAVEINGKFKTTEASEPAIKQYWQIGATGNFLFPNTDLSSGEQIPELNISASTGANKRLIVSQIDSGDHTVSETDLSANFTIGSPQKLKLLTNGSLTFLNDDIGKGINETAEEFGLSVIWDINNFPFTAGLRIESESQDIPVGSIADNLYEFYTLIDIHKLGSFQYQIGSKILINDGITMAFWPTIKIIAHLSNHLELGTSFDPENKLVGLKDLLKENLFYSPLSQISINSSLYPFNVVTEPIDFRIFTNYFLSLEDELHAELRYITRNNEPVFNSYLDSSHHVIFDAVQTNTKRIEIEAGGSLLLFTKDQVRASLIYRSATERQTNGVLPFVPTAQIQASYQIGNLSDKIIPRIEFLYLSREDRSFAFVNAEVPYLLSKQFQIKLRAENIFRSPGDFWTGYNEYPQAIWVSAKYAF